MNQSTVGFDGPPEQPPTLPLSLGVSLAVPPLLLGLLIQQDCAQTVQAIGRFSEEVFQGYQLPKRPFPGPGQSQ